MRDNYAISADAAKALFRTYDPSVLRDKLGLADLGEYLPVKLFHRQYRIRLADGDVSRLEGERWVDANSFSEVMTLLDLVCDSRTDRHPAGRWKTLQAFGHQFHSRLMEDRDPNAEAFAANPAAFRSACQAMGGIPFPHGNIAYQLPLFEELSVVLQLWLGDEEFPAHLTMLLDKNADQYLRYETMHYARGLLLHLLREETEKALTKEGC